MASITTKKSGDLFRVNVFLGFVRRSGTTRAEGPHVGPQHARGAKRNRVDHSRAHGLVYLPFAGDEPIASVVDLSNYGLEGEKLRAIWHRSAPAGKGTTAGPGATSEHKGEGATTSAKHELFPGSAPASAPPATGVGSTTAARLAAWTVVAAVAASALEAAWVWSAVAWACIAVLITVMGPTEAVGQASERAATKKQKGDCR